MLLKLVVTSLMLVSLGSRCAVGDEVEILSNEDTSATSKKLPQDQRMATIASFFEDQGLRISLEENEYDRYSDQVVAKMAELLENKLDFLKVYHLTRQINSMIHGSIAAKESSADEAILKALDLIIPKSESQPIFEIAKEDLRQFYNEQPDQCRELLERIGARLNNEELHTHDAIQFLEGALHNWVPLGRLAKFIEDNGQTV